MIGAVVAMDSEAEILLSQMEIEHIRTVYGKPLYTGRFGNRELAVAVCGVGKVNAAAGTCAVLEQGATLAFNFGVAGGLRENTEVAGVYLVHKTVQYDFDLTQLNGGAPGTLDGETENFLPLATPALGLPHRALGSGDRFNDSPADHDLLLSLGADLRDMEGAAIAQICKYAGVPCVSVKAVSDLYGTGSTTEQFQKNLKRALLNLKAELPSVLEKL